MKRTKSSYKFTVSVLPTCPKDKLQGTLKKKPAEMTTLLFEEAYQEIELDQFYDTFSYKYNKPNACGKIVFSFVETETGETLTFLEVHDNLIKLKPLFPDDIGFYEVSLLA